MLEVGSLQNTSVLLSIITPVLNQARYLSGALESVAAISAAHEHLVIDGSSDDGTVELLRGRDDRALRWTSEPDRGQTHAFNKGLEQATGDLICWLNGDDAYIPAAIDRAIERLRAEPSTMAVCGGAEFIDEDGELIRRYVPPGFSWRRSLLLGNYVPTEAIIFRRELLEQAPRLDERWTDAADYDFFLRLLRAVRVKSLAEPIVRFRYHSESKTVSDVWRQHDEALAIRLGWARGWGDRALIKALDRLQRLILPRISSWPDPHPARAGRLAAKLTGHGGRDRGPS